MEQMRIKFSGPEQQPHRFAANHAPAQGLDLDVFEQTTTGLDKHHTRRPIQPIPDSELLDFATSDLCDAR